MVGRRLTGLAILAQRDRSCNTVVAVKGGVTDTIAARIDGIPVVQRVTVRVAP